MIPGEGIAIDQRGQEDVRGSQQGQRKPELAARPAGTEEQEGCSNGSEGQRVRQKSYGNGDNDEYVCEHEHPSRAVRGIVAFQRIAVKSGAGHCAPQTRQTALAFE
jgi:hypothetical protein